MAVSRKQKKLPKIRWCQNSRIVEGFHPLFHESDLAPLFHPLSALFLKETAFSGRNTIFDILAQSSFHKYISCWVFLAIHHLLYLCMCVFVSFCICIFVFAILTHGNTIFDILAHSSFHKYISCWVFLALSHMLYLCMCVFVSFCICVFVCVWDRVGIA